MAFPFVLKLRLFKAVRICSYIYLCAYRERIFHCSQSNTFSYALIVKA